MKISPFKVISSDYLALLCVLTPLIMVILYVDVLYFGILQQFFSRGRTSGLENPKIFLILSVAALGICIPILVLRMKSIANHFKNGIEVTGKIVLLRIHKDRGRIEYEYTVDNENYRSGNAVHKTKFVNSLAEGKEVNLVVAKNNHKKAFIKEMYMSR